MSSISDTINKLRKEKKVSQRELAEKIEMSFRGLQVALDKGDFKVSTLEKIADYLQVPVSYFFDTPGINIQNVGNGNAGSVNILNSENERLKDKVEGLEREIELLREMNDLLKNK